MIEFVFSKENTLIRMLAIVVLTMSCCVVDISAQSQKPKPSFPLERDHVFVWVSPGAPEADKLKELGLYTDGQIHKHVGQGTASKVFLFENAYLELIWVDEPDVARANAQAMNTDVAARANWKTTGASPFGIGLHYLAEETTLPFATKKYSAPWMKPDTTIDIAASAVNVKEPFFFVVPEYLKAPSPEKLKQALESKPELRKSFTHALGVHQLTNITITPQAQRRFSKTAALLSANRVVVLKRGSSTYAELMFDGGSQGKTLDVRPALPLKLKY